MNINLIYVNFFKQQNIVFSRVLWSVVEHSKSLKNEIRRHVKENWATVSQESEVQWNQARDLKPQMFWF